MTAFGFSAFLKLLSSNPRPRRTTIRNRLVGGKGGYDFHRSLRLRIHRYLVDGEDIDDLIASADDLANPHEANAVKRALRNFELWKTMHPGSIFDFADSLYTSPRDRFSVRFTCDFGLEIHGRRTAIHVWNTKTADLEDRTVYALLALMMEEYRGSPHAPDDLALLSLIDGRLYRLCERPELLPLAQGIVAQLDDLFHDVEDELGIEQPADEHPPGP